MSLRATHQGYAYQDLIAGVALVDLILGTAVEVCVDTKGSDGDRFDDLTINYRSGQRTRMQIKHTAQNRALSKATFSGDGRSLKLDLLLQSLRTDLSTHPGTEYRLLVRDAPPASDLADVLTSVASADDPGDPLPGITTRRYRFDAQALRENAPWSKLVEGLTQAELLEACAALTIDTCAPSSTLDMSEPGPAELALLRRVTDELGVGKPPNTHISSEAVALSLTAAALAARALMGNVTREFVSPRIGLTTDFGAVVVGHPVEEAVAVSRTGATTLVREHVETAATEGGRVVITGEPGVGKSWLCEQLAEVYETEDWLVARHHCWLGTADIDRDERVLTRVVIGSLIGQLERIAPGAVEALRPRYAATPEALEAALRTCRNELPERRILLIVDGLDHVDRVVGRYTDRRPDPSRLLVDQLASIELPAGTALLMATQPGPHLENANPTAGREIQLPPMSWDEVRALAQRHRIIDDDDTIGVDATTLTQQSAIVNLLHSRSGGNALYATYLCRDAARIPRSDQNARPAASEILDRLSLVPDTANDLDAYYAHLLGGLTGDQEFAIGALAVCDFGMSADELGEIIPEVTVFLAPALVALAPILNSQPGLGGLRVHHESFGRYILSNKPSEWVARIRGKAAGWLTARGFFADARAFRNLPRLLAQLDNYEDLKTLLKPGFVSEAIRALQPPEALKQVLSIVARESALRLDWPALAVCVETRKGIDTYELESLPSTLVRYADVVVSILGAESVAARLLHEGRTTFPARWGLMLCKSADLAGAAVPWDEYLKAQEWEEEHVRTSRSFDDDGALHLAIQLGRLRLRSQRGDLEPDIIDSVAWHFDGDLSADLDELVQVFVAGLPAGAMPAVAAKMTDPIKSARVYVALANLAAGGTRGLPDPRDLVHEAWTRAPAGDIISFLSHGIPPHDVLAGLETSDLEQDLQAATVGVLSGRSPNYDDLYRWLSLLTLAHATSPAIPLRLTSELAGVGFYRAWLRFAAATVGLADDVANGATPVDAASSAVLVALSELAKESAPFTGTPRACDLYSIHPLIHRVIERALVIVRPDDLDPVLDSLISIGDGTTTSLLGNENGPLTANDLVELLSRVSGQVGVAAVHALFSVIRGRRDDRFGQYSLAADFELVAARICLAADATSEANLCWATASKLLASYGGHKDPTITEFIDSIADLALVDSGTARTALGKLLELAYLVRQHTDGRGTAHVAISWWETAAKVDPIAAALDGATVLIAELGFEDSRVQAAHETLLETRVTSADPIVLAALRLTAGMTRCVPSADLALLARLQPEVGITPEVDAAIASVANNVAASYDDQPLTHSSVTPETTATTDLVRATQALGGTAFPIRMPRKEPDQKGSPFEAPKPSADIRRRLESSQRPDLPAGLAGAVLAARDFAQKSYDDDPTSARWNIDALTSAIGWRLLEATQNSGAEEGLKLVDAVAREIPTYANNEVFALLGRGLASRCNSASTALKTVASYCLTLAFIRIRGRGGWETFAGRERTELWRDAHALDPMTAGRALAAGIVDIVDAETQRTYGVTPALIAALAVQPTGTPGGSAIECWDAAYGVLRERLPGEAQRNHHTYTPTSSSESDEELNIALATLSIASISQVMRADLRHAIHATALLLTCRPAIAQSALVRTFQADLDAGRATWLLEVVRDHLSSRELTDDFAATLASLAQTDVLSVRVLAGEILGSHGRPVPHPPATGSPVGSTMVLGSFGEDGSAPDEDAVSTSKALLDFFVGPRLETLSDSPGLSEDVAQQLADRMANIKARVREQVEHLGLPRSRRFPDGYLFDEEAAENALQRTAASIRTTRARVGIISDPIAYERSVATRLSPTASWSLRAEASRVPRPPTRARALDWSMTPIPWENDKAEWPPAAAVALSGVRQLATPDDDVVRVSEEPYPGWVQLGFIERQSTLPLTYPKTPGRHLWVATGLEVRDRTPSSPTLPLSTCRPDLWARSYLELAPLLDSARARHILASTTSAIAAIVDFSGADGRPSREHGPGLPLFVLSPSIEVAALLDLRPESPSLRQLLVDDEGPAVVYRQWHGFLVHDGSFRNLVPAVQGGDLILRPDLYERLADAAGRDRLSIGLSVQYWVDDEGEDGEASLPPDA